MVVARASGNRRGEIGWIVAVSAALHPAVTVLQKYEARTGGGALVGVDVATGCSRWGGSGDRRRRWFCEQHSLLVNKICDPFPGGERKHLDDTADSGSHGS